MTRRLCFSLSLIALASACTAAIRNTSGATETALMQSDRDFTVETHARGIEGWMSFFAPDAIRIRYRDNMVRGLNAIRRFDLPGISDTTTTLNWEPTDAHVFRGGGLGSTTGRYWIVSRKPGDAGKQLGHGRYVTMWRRDGGRWLVIMDTGYPEPWGNRQVFVRSQMRKTPHPFGYGAGYWWPTRPTSSASSTNRGSRNPGSNS